jgi:hypothetical protein
MHLLITINGLQDSWNEANRDVLWGWKRDSGSRQRIILFGTSLLTNESGPVELRDWFFFYRSRAEEQEISEIAKLFKSDPVESTIGCAAVRTCQRTGMKIIELSGGPGLARRQSLILRLLKRRPRKRIPIGIFPSPTIDSLDLSGLGRIVAYVGSGLSYESGIPTLASVHEMFGVDHLGDADFTFGSQDPLPRQLAENVSETFSRFIHFHLLAAIAAPSSSHRVLATLHRSGSVTRILTDNIDNLFSKLDVPFTRTRGIGIFNDRFPIQFKRNEKTLLVIGVAADRRLIIQQARKQGLRIVVVNPEEAVSPKSQNLSYLRPEDTWYRTTAHDFFARYTNY